MALLAARHAAVPKPHGESHRNQLLQERRWKSKATSHSMARVTRSWPGLDTPGFSQLGWGLTGSPEGRLTFLRTCLGRLGVKHRQLPGRSPALSLYLRLLGPA